MAAITDPRILPRPPSTTNTRIMMDLLYPKLADVAARVARLWAYRTPAIPARAAEMENAISLYLVMLIPMDSAAIRLSRMDMMARPVRELIRFNTITRVSKRSRIPIVKVAALGVPVIPWAPLTMTSPPSSSPRDKLSLMEKWNPLESLPINITLIRFLMISPKARVTIAR